MLPVHDALIVLIPRLRRYARMLCADRAAADDLVQDTLERACARIAQWHPDSDLRAWTFSIMHNLFISETRRPRHRVETSRDAAGDEAVLEDKASAPVDGRIATHELERALRALPHSQLQVLLLIAFADMSYEQVAIVIGVPKGTVMSRLSRARARLRGLLEPGAEATHPVVHRLRVLK